MSEETKKTRAPRKKTVTTSDVTISQFEYDFLITRHKRLEELETKWMERENLRGTPSPSYLGYSRNTNGEITELHGKTLEPCDA